MHTKKRVFSLLTTFVMLFAIVGVMPTMEVGAIYQSEVSSQLSSLISSYNGKTATSSQMIYGTQCKGFANWVFQKIFGVYIGPYPDSANYKISNPQAETVGIIEPGNLNVNTSRELLQKGKPGDYIQVQRSTARGRGPHSMILVSVRSDGIEVFDCNSDGKNTIKNYVIAWASFDTANRAMSLYHAHNYIPDNPPPIPPNPVNEKYRVSTSSGANLRVRSTPSTSGSIVREVANGTEFTISQKSNNWGYCDSFGGWLCLDYCIQINPAPTGYSIEVSSTKIYVGEQINIYITPYDDNVTGYKFFVLKPNGETASKDRGGSNGVGYSPAEAGTYIIYGAVYNDYGEYKGSVTDGAIEVNVIKKEEPSLSFNTKIVNLDLAGINSETVNITAKGDLPSTYHFNCNRNTSAMTTKWGDWSGSSSPLTISGLKTGEYTINVSLIDANTDEKIYTDTITVNITCSHDYTSKVVSPTYTEKGYTLHTCSKCGHSYKDNYTAVRITEKVSEVVLLQNYLVKKCNLNDEQLTAADLNSDGTVNVFDVVILKRKILKG